MKTLATKYPFVYDVLVIAAGFVVAHGLIQAWNNYVMPSLTTTTTTAEAGA